MGRVAVIPETFAVFAVDPGGTSGWAQGLFRPRGEEPSLKGTLRRAARKGAWSAGEVTGDPVGQGVDLASRYMEFSFRSNVEMGVSLADIHLAIESFHLRKQHTELSPLIVTSAMLARLYEHGALVALQNAEPAMTLGTSERLRDWGVWTVGSEHARDATRHLALRVSAVLRGLVE